MLFLIIFYGESNRQARQLAESRWPDSRQSDHFGSRADTAENVSLTLNGQTCRSLQEQEYLEIARSPYHLQLIKSPFMSYFDILKSKLRRAEREN